MAHATSHAAEAPGVVAGQEGAILALRGYLLVAMLLLIVKAVQLAVGG